jgi:hypothetical protein
MGIRLLLWNAMLFASVFSAGVKADVLWTSALSIDGGNDLHCRISNVTSTRLWVQAESYTADGAVVSNSRNVMLLAHGSAVLTNDDSATGAVACKFTVKDRHAVRASAQNTQAGLGAIAVVRAE